MNIADLLKNTPEGTELYSPIFGKVLLENVDAFIKVYTGKVSALFYKDGRFSETGEVMLFPSEKCRDWSKFKKYLPVGTPVMVSDCKENGTWKLRYYGGNKNAFNAGLKVGNTTFWRHVIPVAKFNFEDCTFKPEDNYGTDIH